MATAFVLPVLAALLRLSLWLCVAVLWLGPGTVTVTVSADLGVYSSSNAAFAGQDNTDLRPGTAPVLRAVATTASGPLAGTTDTIYATFIGDFSSSGPHPLGSFASGSVETVDVQLSRKIGQLQSVFLETTGTDGWVLSGLTCVLGGLSYRLAVTEMFLDKFSPSLAAETGNGYEPNSQRNLDASSTMELFVESSTQLFTSTGFSVDAVQGNR